MPLTPEQIGASVQWERKLDYIPMDHIKHITSEKAGYILIHLKLGAVYQTGNAHPANGGLNGKFDLRSRPILRSEGGHNVSG